MTTSQWGVDIDTPRECHLYEFEVRDPHTSYRTTTCGYIGESGRQPFDRLLEHLREKPWGDTIVGWRIIETHGRKRSVLAAEATAVQARRPLYNIDLNGGNPRRIPPWVQVRQRAARDRAKGLPTPTTGATRPAARPLPRAGATGAWSPAKRRPRRRAKALPRLGVWAAITAVAWGLAAGLLPVPPVAVGAPIAAGVAACMTYTAPTWRAGRGWRRRTCEGWGVLLGLVALALLGWTLA